MNFKTKFLNILVILIILLSGCEHEIRQYNTDEEILRLMDKYDLPSISACIFRNNEIIWERSYGYSDRELRKEADAETIYHIASISKLFICTAVMQLDERGEINIDEDINNYLPVVFRNPHFPDVPITARMLLTHSSGLVSGRTNVDIPEIWNDFEPDQAPTPSEWIPRFLVPSGDLYNMNSWVNTPPGTFEIYSNIGATVLAYLVEQVSGKNFRDYCMENIFIPLKMENTSYNYEDLELTNIAVLYQKNNRISDFFDNMIYAAGGLKTTTRDMSRFGMAYLNGGVLDGNRILNDTTIDRIFEIKDEVTDRSLIWDASLGGWFGHIGGLTKGAATTFNINPEKNAGLIIFCNKHHGSVYPGHEIYGLIKQKVNGYID